MADDGRWWNVVENVRIHHSNLAAKQANMINRTKPKHNVKSR